MKTQTLRFCSGIAIVIASLAVLAGPGAIPSHAASSNGGVYVVTPKWWGHCTNFGGVAGIAAVNSYVGFSNKGDYGDDIIWVPVRLNARQSVQVKTICKRFGGATGTSISIDIRPTRNKQTFFVGADSTYWHN